jgi:hypothetical protein
MPDYPAPPILPADLEEFEAHARQQPQAWYEYLQQVYTYLEQQTSQQDALNRRVAETEAQREELRIEVFKAQGANELLDLQLEKKDKELQEARDRIRTVAYPLIASPPTASPLGEATPPDTQSTASTRLSERLPDPDKFTGDRADLRRFATQMRQKLLVNRDRFPDSQSRMTYVTGRLSGTPYAQVLPYISRGRCSLPDYEDVLRILENAYGDPNQARNARGELYRLRQKNRDFSTFFAEFHRLALEGEMSEDALPTMLEQAISDELREMLLHHDLPVGSFTEQAAFLQELDNRLRNHRPSANRFGRRRTTNQPSFDLPATKRVSRSPPQGRPASPPRGRQPSPRPAPAGDPMDLSRQKHAPGWNRYTERKCYRCGSSSHFVQNCPQPDTRPIAIRNAYRRRSSSYSRSQSPGSDRPAPARDLSRPVNGASLE